MLFSFGLVAQGSVTFRQNFFIKPMLDEGIPFDSDCIDDQLFDSAFHWKKISPMYSVDDIVNDLTSNGKEGKGAADGEVDSTRHSQASERAPNQDRPSL